MPETDTVLFVPACLVAKVADPYDRSRSSPPTRSSESVTVAAVVPSYGRSPPVAPTCRGRLVMLAVVDAVVPARS